MTGHKCSVFRFSNVEVHERELQLKRAGKALSVEPKAFRVLIHLLRNAGRLVPKDELLNAGWGDTAVTENSLTRNIALLRRLLDDDTRAPRYIETVSTVGYRFIGSVEAIEDATATLGQAMDGTGAEEPVTPTPNPIVEPITSATAKPNWRRWLWPVATAGVALLAVAYWYLRQPLPPPRIVGDYVPITLDGKTKLPVGTDGNRLYMNLYMEERIAQVPISGGQVSELQIDLPMSTKGSYAFGPALLDVSPDGSSLLVFDDVDQHGVGEIWVVGSQGRPARYLTRASHAAWSPDGKSVVFCGAFGDFHLIPSEGGESRLLINLSQLRAAAGLSTATPSWSQNGHLRWSPDGRAIRFDWNHAIWEMSPSGANLHNLLPNWRSPSFKCCGQWTPDGDFYIFQSGNARARSGTTTSFSGQLFALDERRGLWQQPDPDPIRLTSGPTLWDEPVPSRDGRRIFARGATPRGELLRWNGEAKQLEPYLGGVSAEFLAFSRDDKSVAYVSYPEGILWRANRDGSGQMQLTKPPFYPLSASWSPDGAQILFEDYSPAGVYSMYVIPVQGGTPARLLPEDNNSQTDPSWSPDGKSLVYAFSAEGGDMAVRNRDLRVLDLATHKATKVPGSEGCWSPRWSPDGRYIAALTASNGIAVFDVKIQHRTTLQEKGLGFPTFSHDSRWIYFLRFSDAGVFRVPVSGGSAEQIVNLRDFRLAGFWGFWMGLDPTDAPLLLRDEGTDEIYALNLDRK